MIKKGSSKEVSFEIHPKDLAFYRMDKKFAPEAVKSEVFIGTSSDSLAIKGTFELVN